MSMTFSFKNKMRGATFSLNCINHFLSNEQQERCIMPFTSIFIFIDLYYLESILNLHSVCTAFEAPPLLIHINEPGSVKMTVLQMCMCLETHSKS